MEPIIKFILAILLFSTAVTNASGGQIFNDVPAKLDRETHYLFYMHGSNIETDGIGSVTPRFGVFEYQDILERLASGGVDVISEVRKGYTGPHKYSKQLASKISRMIEQGVPASNISIAGFSKGGYLALLTAKQINNPDVKFIIMAGCFGGILTGRNKYVEGLQGTILSMVDHKDDLGASCAPLFERNKHLKKSKDIIFQNGSGHGYFFSPRHEWIDMLLNWTRQ